MVCVAASSNDYLLLSVVEDFDETYEVAEVVVVVVVFVAVAVVVAAEDIS